jgi:hypothetical protein
MFIQQKQRLDPKGLPINIPVFIQQKQNQISRKPDQKSKNYKIKNQQSRLSLFLLFFLLFFLKPLYFHFADRSPMFLRPSKRPG